MKLFASCLLIFVSSVAFPQSNVLGNDSFKSNLASDTPKTLISADSIKGIMVTIPDADKAIANTITSQAWQPKDFITLFASILAIIISSIGIFQKWYDKKTDYRKQLTTLMEKITSLNMEAEKYKIKPAEAPANYQSLINDQRRFFVRDAAFIADKIKSIVRPFEWNVIAWAFAKIDEPEEAERYFLMSIHKAITAGDKGLTNRSYAGFCFDEKRFDRSNEYYEKAMAYFEGNNDRMIYYRSVTLERWALIFKNRDEEKYRAKIQMACDQWKSHSNTVRAQLEIQRIQRNLQPS